MDDLQKKRYLREKKRKAQLAEDLRPELLLKQEMDITKKKVHNQAPSFERFRAYVQLEDEASAAADGSPNQRETDYELNFKSYEIVAKSLKNKERRLDQKQLGVYIYGKCLLTESGEVHPMVKEALKCARTLLAEKKSTRTRETVTEEEIKMLEDKYVGLDLPTGDRIQWEWTGFCYQNFLSDTDERCYRHPNREFLIERYLQEVNADIGSFNRNVQKEWKMDL